MTCDSAQVFLEAYVDRELDAPTSLNMEEHLRTCESCSRLQARLEELRRVIAAESPRYRAPENLRRRIQSDLRASAPSVGLRKKHVFDWKWAAIAASVLVSAVALWQMQSHQGQDRETSIAKEIVSSHVRSLMANHLVDEPSSDQHTVKPWFAGKLDFSPAVKNLDAQGFAVAGGRLDYMGNRPVAAIVYRRRQHVINVFVWPSPLPPAAPRNSVTVNGFNTVNWVSEGMRYWAISDLNKQELELFSRLWSHQ
jgi:anti-sigma factor RsiW